MEEQKRKEQTFRYRSRRRRQDGKLYYPSSSTLSSHRVETPLARHSVIFDAQHLISSPMTASTNSCHHRKLNTSPNSIADPDLLKVPLCTPPIKKIDLVWPSGLSVTARNMKGLTIKDALEAIHKQFKKKVRLPSPLLPIPTAILSSSTCQVSTFIGMTPANNVVVNRQTTNSMTSPSLPASNGTAKNATPASSCTRRRRARP